MAVGVQVSGVDGEQGAGGDGGDVASVGDVGVPITWKRVPWAVLIGCTILTAHRMSRVIGVLSPSIFILMIPSQRPIPRTSRVM